MPKLPSRDDVIDTFQPVFSKDKKYDGGKLKDALGISKFKYCYIQKVLDTPMPIFIVTVDSRYPDTYLSMQKVKKIKSSSIKRMQKKGDNVVEKKFKLTPPLPIESAHISMNSRSIIFMRDIAGDYFRDAKMFESVNDEEMKRLLHE